MTRRLLATGLLALLLASSPAAASAAAPRPSARSPLVVIVLAPFVSWTDVLEGHTPYLKDIAEDAALGDMNVTSLVPEAGRPSAESGALMLSAGSWTRYDSVSPAACIGNARGGITYTGLLDQIAAQRGTRVLATPGALGQAVRDGGGVTAAIGGSRLLVGGAVEVSPAVLVAMDASGTVDLGTVSPALLRAGGPASDPDAVGGEFSAVLADPRVRRGPALVVVDPGDLQRADASSAPSPRAVEALPRTRALASLDATVREVRGRMPQGATLIVVSQTAARQVSGVTGYGPLLILGPAERGFLTSSSTRRRGVVTSADLSATVLDALGVRAPATFIGAPLSSDGEESSAASRIELLEAKDAMSRAVDAARPFVVDAYIVAVVLVFGFAVVLLALPAVPRRLVVSAQVLMMAVLSVPAASIVMFVPVRYPSSEPLVVALLVAMTLLVWTLAVSSHYNSSLPRGAAFLAAFTAAVVLLDQLTGARLSFSSLFGYSPVVGARYYGIGNESAALLVGGALTGLTILLDHSASQHWVSAARRYGLPAVAFVCVLTAAAPFLGANIGVAVWGTFAFVLAVAAGFGRRLDWRTVLVAAVAVALVVGAFTAIDILAPSSSRTHLGKAVAGERGAFAEMLARKAATNVSVLTRSMWSILFLGIVLVLGWMAFRPTGALQDVLLEHPLFAGALTACLLGGAVAYFTEDSGIVVPALLLLFPTAGVIDLMLGHKAEVGPR